MSLSRYEFEVLAYLEQKGEGDYTLRSLSDALCISGNTITVALEEMLHQNLLTREGTYLAVTAAGLERLEPYRVKRAIVVGAGLGSRMMPATADIPKPMVTVNGVRIIDTLLDALVSVGIRDITLVGGYRFEKLEQLKDKYPFLRLLNNNRFEKENNISSAILAMDYFSGGCYFCEADLYITNPEVIRKYQYCTNILGSWSLETDDWCFKSENGYASDYQKGGVYCFHYYGISYWTDEDSRRLKKDWVELHDQPGGYDLFWEFPALIQRKENYRIEIRPCSKQDIIEIDHYTELQQLDPGYL